MAVEGRKLERLEFGPADAQDFGKLKPYLVQLKSQCAKSAAKILKYAKKALLIVVAPYTIAKFALLLIPLRLPPSILLIYIIRIANKA